jgi:hypothetical protein
MRIKLTSVHVDDPMKWNAWMRQLHRWLSIAFTVAVIAVFVALNQPDPVEWVSYVPLLPLALLLVTGLYLFALPYASRWRSDRANMRGPVVD